MKNFKYLYIAFGIMAFTACNDPEDVDITPEMVMGEQVELTAGSADFSNYVSLGNSLTAGFTDGALFQASQNVSLPNLLSQKFSLVGGGSFTQPLMNDNFGGLAAGGTRIQGPRLVFGGAGPVPLESVIGPVTVTTDIALNNPVGPFNNMGVPGAKSFHLLFDGYGNLGNLSAGLANPYFIRMASSRSATMLNDALVQMPTFFSLWIGNNDVLGYATTGGDGTNPLTPLDGPIGTGFSNTYQALIGALTQNGRKGVVANIPNVVDIPHFTTVPYNPLSPANPAFGPLIPTLNGIFGQLNQVYAFLESQNPAISAEERSIVFSSTAASAVVVRDETLIDLSAQISGVLLQSPTFPTFVQSFGLPAQAAPLVAGLLGSTYGQTRQATEADLFVLPVSSIIGQPNLDVKAALMAQGLPETLADQFAREGITYPLVDKWVLLPSEQEEIATATAAFNQIIEAAAQSGRLGICRCKCIIEPIGERGYYKWTVYPYL